MSQLQVEMILIVLVALGGAAQIRWSRSLEKRIFSIERSLGAYAGLGAAGGDPLNDDQVLRHLEAITASQLEELKSNKNPLPQPAKEP